jgi:hypothetical protein
MTIRTEQNDARSFLLARLTQEETEQFEERLLVEDDLIAETEAAETELLDELVRGILSPEESAVVAERFRGRPERIAFAKTLASRTRPRPQQTMRWILPIAASLVIVAGVVLLSSRREPSPQTTPVPRASLQQPARTPAPIPAPPAPTQTARRMRIATITIALAATRDDNETPSLLLSREIDVVALRIRINPADRFPAYEVDVTNDTANVWNGRATRAESSSELLIEIPAGRLGNGEHQIAVTGFGKDRLREELGYQTLLIRGR